MDNKEVRSQEPAYNLKHLETFVQLTQFLTGELPKVIRLASNVYEAHTQETQHQAELMGLNQGFKDDKVTFLGIPLEKIEKKVEIITPTK